MSMRPRSRFAVALIAAGALFAAACGQAAQPSGSSQSASPSASSGGGKPIVIGLQGPLSGSSSQYGQEALKSANLVINAWNAKGGVLGRQIKLVSEDTQGDAKQGAIVANKLISEGVVAVLAPDFSGSCSASMPVYEQNRIPMITSICTAPSLSEQGFKYFFRSVSTDAPEGPFVADYLVKQLHLSKLAVLDDQSTYGQEFADLVAKGLQADGAQIVAREHIKAGEKDYTATLTKVKAANPDGVVYGGYYPEYGLLLKQASQIGLKATFLGSSMERPETIQLAGGQPAVGALSAGYPSPTQLKASAGFAAEYQKAYSAPPGPMTNLTYDAADMLLQAIQKAGTTDEPKLRDAIAATDLKGASGEIKVDSKGDRTTPFFEIFKAEDQGGTIKWVPLGIGEGNK